MKRHIAFISLGTNVGSNLGLNIDRACCYLKNDPGTRLVNSSALYESRATVLGRVTPEQRNFYNCAVKVETTRSPFELLSFLKEIERDMGRNFNERVHGPRIIDLDVVMYCQDTRGETDPFHSFSIQTETLTIPHPRLTERDFVLQPLRDILSPTVFDTIPKGKCNVTLMGAIGSYGPNLSWTIGNSVAKKVAIMNATPDSFSDGGKLGDPLSRAEELIIVNRADALDIGGESTRPGASKLLVGEELERIIPAIKAASQVCKAISIDTYNAEVAKVAFELGATVVNDVTAGRDPAMFPLVASTAGASVVLMHSRGNSQTMDKLTEGYGDDIIAAVATDLGKRIDCAIAAGIPRWRIIVDPGIGFAKKHTDSLKLLTCSDELRSKLNNNVAVMIGHSRKRFLKPSFLNIDVNEAWPSDETRERVNQMATEQAVRSGADLVRIHM